MCAWSRGVPGPGGSAPGETPPTATAAGDTHPLECILVLGVNYYRRRMELREGNVFIRVCPSVSHSVHRVGVPM